MATQKWHISKAGKPARCDAQVRCRLSPQDQHGATPEEALAKHEERLKQEGMSTLPPTERRSPPPDSERPRPLKPARDKSFPVDPATITVSHDPQAKYAVLSDVDGTLTRGSLVLDHAIYLHDSGAINLGDLPQRWRADPKNEKLVDEFARAYRAEVAGMRMEDLRVEEFLDDYEALDGKFYSTMDQLKEFKRRGWEIQLISGSPDFLVGPFAERNGFFGKGSTYHADAEGVLTGEVDGMFGHEAKRGYISKLGVGRFKRVLAFGDTASDVPLFDNADHTTLVDPTEETATQVEASLTLRD